MKQASPPHPRQNRVTPFSEIISTLARGTLMGNRGCLHNDKGSIRRLYQLKRWIICVLEFKDRQRSVMTPGHYTELFFLDEATALAAGHRPCAECQRERFNLFRTIYAKANPEFGNNERPSAPMIDELLHQQRITEDNKKRTYVSRLADLPDGCFVTFDTDPNCYLVFKKELLRWTPFGYEARGNGRADLREARQRAGDLVGGEPRRFERIPLDRESSLYLSSSEPPSHDLTAKVIVLTPRSIVRAIQAGYQPQIKIS
jgi:hypothetical protein